MVKLQCTDFNLVVGSSGARLPAFTPRCMNIAATYIMIELKVSANCCPNLRSVEPLRQHVCLRSLPAQTHRFRHHSLKYELARTRIDGCGEREYTRERVNLDQTLQPGQ